MKRFARFLVGMIGLLLIYFGLKIALPAGDSLLDYFFRYTEVKEILGHQEISRTMRYAHVRQEQLRDAVSRIPVFHRIFTDETEDVARTAEK